MLILDLHGALDEYSSFPEPLERSRLRRMALISTTSRVNVADSIAFARQQGRPDRVRDLTAALWRSRLLQPLRGIRRRLRDSGILQKSLCSRGAAGGKSVPRGR
jgi:hypothetical protein